MGSEKTLNTLYSPVQARSQYRSKLSEVTPIINMTYANPENQVESPFTSEMFQTQIKVRKRSHKKSKSSHLSAQQSSDSTAFNLVCLQLSSEGKTYEEMHKKMLKQQRLGRILQKKMQNEHDKLVSSYQVTSHPKNRLQKIFNKIEKKTEYQGKTREDAKLLDDIKNWVNYSLDRPVDVEQKNIKAKPKRLRHKS